MKLATNIDTGPRKNPIEFQGCMSKRKGCIMMERGDLDFDIFVLSIEIIEVSL